MYMYSGRMGSDKMAATKVPSMPNNVNEKTAYNCDFTVVTEENATLIMFPSDRNNA